MRIAVLHDTVTAADAPDARDVLAQAGAVEEALAALGHETRQISCSLNLAALQDELVRWKAELAFNLVESLQGQGRLIHLVPACLDAAALPYTGARAEAMLLTSNKILAKQWLCAAGITTPDWVGPWPGAGPRTGDDNETPGDWIVKSVWEHASIGLDAESIVSGAAPGKAFAALSGRAERLGGTCFAERFVDGREFNLSILGGGRGPDVLPPAEIRFDGFDGRTPRIVDYRAKWDETAWSYHHTPRSFDFPDTDRPLLAALKKTAEACWHAFSLSGYARVDFRVDAAGRPWVLEINANPCLSPDAGFAAALDRAGISFAEAIRRILEDNGSTTPASVSRPGFSLAPLA